VLARHQSRVDTERTILAAPPGRSQRLVPTRQSLDEDRLIIGQVARECAVKVGSTLIPIVKTVC
jgi:hypothetical protein